MAAFDKTDVRSAEAGLKYFLFGSTASAFTLFGISFIYGMSGTTGLAAVGQKLATQSIQPLLFVGVVMTLVGFAFKIAAAPFHLWAPDAYQGAPLPSAAFIASGSKVASFVVLGKIVLVGFGPVHGSAAWHAMIAGWAPVLAVLAALSIVIGNLVALAQSNVRRLLAYSAVAHAGYTLLGLVAGGRDGFSATLFYTTVYAFTLVGAFSVIALVRRETGKRRFTELCRTPFAFTIARRVHVDLHAVAGRLAAAHMPFRKVLPLQRRVARKSKSWPARLSRWHSSVASSRSVLPNRAQSDFYGSIR
jgi:NADH-quinone oxidoreductase subunit N